jgi:hypothetical protein
MTVQIGGTAIMVSARSASARTAATVAILATTYFAVAAVATHLVSPQYDLVKDYISDYAVGPYGWIYGSAFLASFVGCTALAAALATSVPREARSTAGIALLLVVGATYARRLPLSHGHSGAGPAPADGRRPGPPPRRAMDPSSGCL